MLQVECTEFDNGEAKEIGRKGRNKMPLSVRIFEARESAADLAVGLEEKVKIDKF